MRSQPQEAADSVKELDLAAIMRALKQGIAIIVLCVVVTMFIAVAYILDTVPLYTASASILVDPYRPHSTLVPEPLSDSPVDEAVVDTQVELIKSESVARLAIKRLGASADPLILGVKKSNLKVAKEFVTDWIKSHMGKQDDGPPDHTLELIRALEESLTVKRKGLTFIIDVAFQGETASGAATVSNIVASAYLDDQISTKVASAQQVSRMLSDRAADLRKLSEDADRKVQAYQGNDRIVLQQLNSASETARTTLETFQRRAMETEQAADNSVSVARLVSPASPPDARSWPRSTIILAGAIVAGVSVGFGISLARQRFGRFYRDGTDVTADFGKFVGLLRLKAGRRLARKLRQGTLKSTEVVEATRDVSSGFADVVRRVAVGFDPVVGSADRVRIGVLTFGDGISGGLLAFRLAVGAAAANKSTTLLEAQPVARIIGQAWGINGERTELALADDDEFDALHPSNKGKLFGLSLSPHEAIDVTPAKVRELIDTIGGGEQVTVVSFSDHDFGSIGAWISGLDAYVMVVERKRTPRSDASQVMSEVELQLKCIGIVLV